MRFPAAVVPLVVLALTAPAMAGPRSIKPRFDLRATPRIAFPPVRVLVTAELSGGEDLEDFYCPGLEWDWGDGERSLSEADCEPYAPGAALERRFSSRHVFRHAGDYDVRLTLRRADRAVAMATVRVSVQSGVGGGVE